MVNVPFHCNCTFFIMKIDESKWRVRHPSHEVTRAARLGHDDFPVEVQCKNLQDTRTAFTAAVCCCARTTWSQRVYTLFYRWRQD